MGDSKIQQGTIPKEATVITNKQSMNLSELLTPFMKLSNNGHGEMLTKEMGKVIYGEGSWDKGLQVIEDVVAAFGKIGRASCRERGRKRGEEGPGWARG